MASAPGLRYLVLGARGQLAQEFLRVLGPQAQGRDRSQLDLADPAALATALAAARPDVVLNCAAFNQVDLAETEQAQALTANAEGPAHLAQLASEQGWRLVHFSTDYVFGGDGLSRPRVESDPPAPLNFYGESKLRGERAVQRDCPQALVLRVAHLYGGASLSPGRANLVQRFVAQARAGQPIWVAPQQTLNPTSVRDIVPATLALLERSETGLFHLTGEGECGAADFVAEVLRFTGLHATIQFVERDTRPARRSPYTVLENQRLAMRGLPPMPNWRTSLAACLADPAVV